MAIDCDNRCVSRLTGAGAIAVFGTLIFTTDATLAVYGALAAACLAPALLLTISVPDAPPYVRGRAAAWVQLTGASLYLAAILVAGFLTAYRGFDKQAAFLLAFTLLGVWPCIVVIRRVLAARVL